MVNAYDFGATGDGATDDTNALEHALEAGDGVLQLQKGTFRITRPLVVDLRTTGYAAIQGNAGTSRILMDGPGPAIRVVGNHGGTASPPSVTTDVWEQERFPNFVGFEILGRHPEAVGIELRRTMQATVSRVAIRQCKVAIHLVERNRNFVLSDSHLYDNHEFGVYFDRCNLHQIILHGNHISYNKKAGIKSVGGDVHNLQITGNDIEYNNQPGVDASPNGELRGAEIWFDAQDGIISEVTIASNTIQATIQPGGTNVRIIGGEQDSPRGARLIAITGNVLGSQTRGIDIRHAQRISITGNTIYDSADLSLFAAHCSGMTVGSNTIVWRGAEVGSPRDGLWLEDCENCILTGLATERLCSGSAERGGGITLVRCRDSAVSDCQILDPLHRGVELEDCVRCRVSNNSVFDRRDKPSMEHAIRVTGDSGQNVVQNNLVGGAAVRLIEIARESAVLQGNIEID